MDGLSPPLLDAGAPLEAPRHRVGRESFILRDHRRDGREVAVEAWYPASTTDGATRSAYEVLPGVAYLSALSFDRAPVLQGRWPLLLLSHGRTGTRIAYSSMCEALAARGSVVVSIEHRGDALADWLSGQQVDDGTNETQRIADAHLVLDALRHGADPVPVALTNNLDHVTVLLGHSYGAYTAFATAAGARGVEARTGVHGVIGLQPYTRTMSDGLLGRLRVPIMLVVSALDRTTPAATDVDRPWALLRGRPLWRLDLHRSGHQACSDIALYAELSTRLDGLPDLVRAYLAAAVDPSDGSSPAPPWRSVVAVQVDACWRFVESLADPDSAALDHETLLGLTHGSVPATLRRYP
jgi:pimeloyl-ACP methyl ester carboxylesterase